MAHTYDATTTVDGSTDPLTLNHTCVAGTTVLVVGVLSNSNPRTGGAPTYDSVALTQAGVEENSTENDIQVWYLLDPPTGSSLELSVPNTDLRNLSIVASSFIAGGGNSSELDVVAQTNAVSADPSLGITPTADGAALFHIMGHGFRNVPTSPSHTQIYARDGGNWSHSAQYALQGSQGLLTFSWTNSSDDWAIINVAFKETTAAAATFAASITGAATVAATLATAITTAAAITASAVVSAALATTITFSGAPIASATVTGALDTEITTAASVTGVGTASGTLEPDEADVTFAASINAVGSAAGALSTEITAAGAVSASGTVAGALETDITAAASVSGVGTVAGALDTDITFEASGSGTGSASGTLEADGILFSASISASGAVAGALATEISFAAAASASGTAAGALETDITFSAAISASGVAAGAVDTNITLAALVTAQGVVIGRLEADAGELRGSSLSLSLGLSL